MRTIPLIMHGLRFHILNNIGEVIPTMMKKVQVPRTPWNDELQEDKFFYSKMSWLTTNTTAVHLVGWNCLHSGKQLNEQKKKKDTEKKVRGKELKMVLIHMNQKCDELEVQVSSKFLIVFVFLCFFVSFPA